jgi:DNA-binding GntR family transcriptional regulator
MARAATVAYEALLRGIATGLYPPGTWLREEDIATRTGVSRTPVREALRRLQSEGFVEILPNRGAVVVGWSAEDLDDIFDLRVMLEGYAAKRAALAASARGVDLDALSELCEAMERQLKVRDGDYDYEQITELNLEFHTALYAASGNRQLQSMLLGLIQIPLVRETFHHYSRDELVRSFAQHREIVDALAADDGDWAEAVMHAHIRAARASLRRTHPAPAAPPAFS